MKSILTLCALALVGGYALTTLPANADNAAKEARDQARAASLQNKADKDVAKGHTLRAGRDARKAERAQKKVAKDEAKAAKGK